MEFRNSSVDSGLCNSVVGLYNDKDQCRNSIYLETGMDPTQEREPKSHCFGLRKEKLKPDEQITNKGWHADKEDPSKIPIDMDHEKAQPGFGMTDQSFCATCALFWCNHCGCPSNKTLKIGLIRVASRMVMAILVWGFFWSVTFPNCAKESANDDQEECVIEGLPGGNLFGIVIVFLAGMTAEALIVLIPMPCGLPTLPPLLGSLLVGILLRNVPGIDIAKYIDDVWSTKLRNMALGIILGRAGLEVDKKQMYKLRWVVPRLAFAPCIIEACSYGVVAHYVLDLPWEWSFMLGFVCGAVAPACVVPSMIKFQEEGYGVDRGVPSLLIAAASLDDIVAINVFNILLTITFGGASIGYNIGLAFVEIALGIVFGVVGGYFLQKIPDRRQHNIIRDRTFLLIVFSFFLIFVTDGPLDIAGAGTLGTLTCSFIAALGWQHRQTEAVAHYFKAIWFFFQPLLFGLTGATVDFSLMDAHTVGLALAVMFICLAIRLTVAGNAVSFLGWSHKEKFMTAIAWIPKATVQAAIGGAALSRVNLECEGIFFQGPCDNTTSSTYTTPYISTVANHAANLTTAGYINECKEQNSQYQECRDWEGYALIILQVAVLLILITAPLGVFLIGVAGPRLLPKSVNTLDVNRGGKEIESNGSGDTSVWASESSSYVEQSKGNHNKSYVPDAMQNTKL